MDSKSVLNSLTIWMLLATGIILVAKRFGLQFDGDPSGLANDLASLATLLTAGYGRFRASQPLHVIPPNQFAASRRSWLAILLAGGLVSCAQMGLEKPKSFDDQLAYAYSTHAALATTLQSLDANHQIGEADYKNAYGALTLSRTGLIDAKIAEVNGDMTSATAKLQAVNLMLTGLQAILAEKKGAR